MRIVVDASVAAKWFLLEEHSPKAAALLSDNHERIAPELLVTEVAHTLVKRVRSGVVDAEDARAFLRRLFNLVEILPTVSLASIALDLAIEHQRSAYDALYAALALREHCQLVTADRRLYDALHASFPGTMLWIEDVESP